MFHNSCYHLLTLDQTLCAVWSQKVHQGHHRQVERVRKYSWAQQGFRYVSNRVLGS